MKRFASILETVPTPCRVCGTSLRPFSLGHHLMMATISLPFAENPHAECNDDQFLRAVFVCAHTYEETLEGHLSGEWAGACEDWMRKVRRSKQDIGAALDVFRLHLKDGYRHPPVWRHVSKDAVALTAPWEMVLKCRLVQAGFSQSEVLNGYLPDMRYCFEALRELDQLDNCSDASNWRRTFYTFLDALEAEQSKLEAENAQKTPSDASSGAGGYQGRQGAGEQPINEIGAE